MITPVHKKANKWRGKTLPFLILLLMMGGSIIWLLSNDPQLAPHAIGKADLIEVEKSKRKMMLLREGAIIAEYKIALGGQPIGHKQFEGDQKTPEGTYKIDFKNAKSRYHLSLRVNYPSAADTSFAEKAGRSPGGDIMIHGQAPGMSNASKLYDFGDWTAGCIAVTNEEIRQIWDAVDEGTKIVIKP
jgi:murein L,D-transpeptidase YafK